MTFRAILKVTNAFLLVLATDIFNGVFVTAVAGISLVVSGRVTGRATYIVVAVQNEIFCVIKTRWLPRFCTVTLLTIAGNLPMQRIARRLVTRLTARQCFWVKQRMLKRGRLPILRCVALRAWHG